MNQFPHQWLRADLFLPPKERTKLVNDIGAQHK